LPVKVEFCRLSSTLLHSYLKKIAYKDAHSEDKLSGIWIQE